MNELKYLSNFVLNQSVDDILYKRKINFKKFEKNAKNIGKKLYDIGIWVIMGEGG